MTDQIPNIPFNHVKLPLAQETSFLLSYKPTKSALGINFDSRNNRKDGHLIAAQLASPTLDDTVFQPILRTNTFEMYKNSNSSDGLIGTVHQNNGNGNLALTILNLTFSPLASSRTNIPETVQLPKERTTPLQKARLFASSKGKPNRDSFLSKRRNSTTSETESIETRSRGKSGTLGGSTKKILLEISSFKPRTPEMGGTTLLRRTASESRRGGDSDSGSIKFHHHHHHHLKLKTRRDGTPINMLSSSSSNSRIMSDAPSMYNFHPTLGASSNEVLRVVSSIESTMTITKNIPELKKVEYSEKLINLLQLCVLPLFKGEVLMTPIEDLTRVVETYLKLRINHTEVKQELSQNMEAAGEISSISDCKVIINEFEDFVRVGLQLLENQSHYDIESERSTRLTKFQPKSSKSSSFESINFRIESRVAALWDFFLHDVLSYLEAIFLPLQMEFEGCGLVLDNPDIAQTFWSKLMVPKEDLKVRRYLLMIFRDSVIIPMVDKLGNVNNFLVGDVLKEDFEQQKLCLLQCFGILCTIQSNDYNQKVVESLLGILKMKFKF